MQLLLGSEVLDLSVQNATQDQSHLFVRHHKVSQNTLLLSGLLTSRVLHLVFVVCSCMFLYFWFS